MRSWFLRRAFWSTGILALLLLTVLAGCDREQLPTPPTLCTYAASPAEFTPCMQPPAELTMTVLTMPECAWRVSASVPWITVTASQSGQGLGMPRFRVSDNWDAPREGLVVINDTAGGQAISRRVAQAGCLYWVSQEEIAFTASGGSGTFDVLQQSVPNSCGGPLQNACLWSASPDVPWITITSSMPRKGDDPVAFAVAPNTGPARTARITVRDKVVRIVQAGH